MKKILFLLFIMSNSGLFAQNKTAEKYAATITPEDLKAKLSVIAGADMEGRETATEGQRKAATYIEDYFKKLKLLPGDSGKYQMSFPVYQDSLTLATLSVNGTTFTLAEDFVPWGSSITAGSWQTPDIVFAGKGVKDSTHNDYDSLVVKGKWVMIGPLADERSFRTMNQRIYLAPQYGAAGLLIVSNNFPRENFTGKGRMYNTLGSSNAFPVLFISHKIAEALLGRTLSNGPDSIEHKAYNTNLQVTLTKTTNNLQSTDVIGVLPGTDKKGEYVFVENMRSNNIAIFKRDKKSGKMEFIREEMIPGVACLIQW